MKEKFFWIVVGSVASVCLFMWLSIVYLQEKKNLPPPVTVITPSPTASTPLAPVPDDNNDSVAQQERTLPPPKGLPSAPPPLSKEMIATHQRMVVGLDKDLQEQTGRIYGAIFKQLNLSPDAQAKVTAILMQPQQKLEQVAFQAAQSGIFPAPPSPQDLQQEKIQRDNALRSALGDDGFAQLQQYETTIPDRTIIDQMNQQDANLTDAQSAQLLQILTDARQQIQGGTPNLSSIPSDQAVAIIQKQQALLQQTVSDRTQSVLTPDQGKALRAAMSPLSIAP